MSRPEPHDWRERVPLGTGYVCADCRRVIASVTQMRIAEACPIVGTRNWAQPMAKECDGESREISPR